MSKHQSVIGNLSNAQGIWSNDILRRGLPDMPDPRKRLGTLYPRLVRANRGTRYFEAEDPYRESVGLTPKRSVMLRLVTTATDATASK